MAGPADQWGDIANRFLFENDRRSGVFYAKPGA
jgi:hypothetical protein